MYNLNTDACSSYLYHIYYDKFEDVFRKYPGKQILLSMQCFLLVQLYFLTFL